jgi:hypothetical protein
MEFTPTLLWSQTYDDIEIEINLSNISNEILRTENNVFHYECFSSNKKYLIDFELEEEVSGHTVSIRNDKKIIIRLQKKEDGIKWDFLTKKRGIYKNNIKINWDKWENSDDEEDVKNINMGGSMDNMMGGMGGMNGMDSGMDMDMLQKMMDGMGHNGEEGSEEGEEGSEEGEEEGSEEGKEEGCEDDTKNIDMGGIEGLII